MTVNHISSNPTAPTAGSIQNKVSIVFSKSPKEEPVPTNVPTNVTLLETIEEDAPSSSSKAGPDPAPSKKSTKGSKGTSDTEEEARGTTEYSDRPAQIGEPLLEPVNAAYARKRDRREESDLSDADETFPDAKKSKQDLGTDIQDTTFKDRLRRYTEQISSPRKYETGTLLLKYSSNSRPDNLSYTPPNH